MWLFFFINFGSVWTFLTQTSRLKFLNVSGKPGFGQVQNRKQEKPERRETVEIGNRGFQSAAETVDNRTEPKISCLWLIPTTTIMATPCASRQSWLHSKPQQRCASSFLGSSSQSFVKKRPQKVPPSLAQPSLTEHVACTRVATAHRLNKAASVDIDWQKVREPPRATMVRAKMATEALPLPTCVSLLTF